MRAASINLSRIGRPAALAVLALALTALGSASAQASTSVSIDPQGKILMVGDATSNSVTVSDQSDPACPGGPPCYEVKSFYQPATATAPCVVAGTPSPNLGTVFCPRAGVTGISGFGREGNDLLLVSDFVFGLGVAATLDGGPGEDRLTGSIGDDSLTGGVDDDEIRGGGGDDRLDGNPGDDSMFGAKGRDRIIGGPGGDDMFGGIGNDAMFGGSGKDLLDGLQGRKDRCVGGGGKDVGRRCERSSTIP